MSASAVRRIAVLYHCPCPDGAFAALAAHMRFTNDTSVRLRFVPHSTSRDLVLGTDFVVSPDEDVYLLDYAGPRDFALHVSKQSRRVFLLDHHKTALEEHERWKTNGLLPDNLDVVLDMNRSGARIAFDYFDLPTAIS